MSATIGGRIRDLRYRRGMTQEELGEKLFMRKSTMLILVGLAAGLVIIPEPVTMFLTEGILSIKDFIGSLAEG